MKGYMLAESLVSILYSTLFHGQLVDLKQIKMLNSIHADQLQFFEPRSTTNGDSPLESSTRCECLNPGMESGMKISQGL